ncbi:hypothetical protein OC834_007373 [Tilletia horrida]|uniref:Glutathione S-transferase n=1 Tax=Tilletia horrida TaxID=155126 RepID=A0AAN6JGQ2_9BASI|nr:hypothetical protein OC834_007373 [Tilletia horrida]KAK0519466.1 hypothetical protein OC842_007449 [Tilletia horrida]KAK0522862.1 hypothetical protein OC835_006436 [Tilletia horrida]KAK0559578.1 hypothetical protein OC844_004312 [Tilletia horrida]
MSKPQFSLYGHPSGWAPNPPKIALFLEWLGLSYELVPLTFDDGESGVKGPKFLAINPNGRMPALVDHGNNDYTVWESGAILLYLADKYDPSGSFYGKTPEERGITAQWLAFQISGVGPMQGQVNWFLHHHEKRTGVAPQPEVLKRYQDETDRVYKVLDGQLARQAEAGSDYIALDRVTIADFAFAGWVYICSTAKIEIAKYSNVQRWYEKLSSDERFKKAYAKLGS